MSSEGSHVGEAPEIAKINLTNSDLHSSPRRGAVPHTDLMPSNLDSDDDVPLSKATKKFPATPSTPLSGGKRFRKPNLKTVDIDSLIQHVRKPSTPFLIFRQSKQDQVQLEIKLAKEVNEREGTNKEIPNLNSALGQAWQQLSPEEKKHYFDLFEAEKATYQTNCQNIWREAQIPTDMWESSMLVPSSNPQARKVARRKITGGTAAAVFSTASGPKSGGGTPGAKKTPRGGQQTLSLNFELPTVRVKSLMLLDENVSIVNKEALSCASKAAECFLAFIARKACQVAVSRFKKTITPEDFYKGMRSTEGLRGVTAVIQPAGQVTTSRNSKRAVGGQPVKKRKLNEVEGGKTSGATAEVSTMEEERNDEETLGVQHTSLLHQQELFAEENEEN